MKLASSRIRIDVRVPEGAMSGARRRDELRKYTFGWVVSFEAREQAAIAVAAGKVCPHTIA